MKLIENNKVELKFEYTDFIVREIVAFLNADGGQIYIGVHDSGIAVGVNDIDETQKRVIDIVSYRIEPSPIELIKLETTIIDSKNIVVVNVSKGAEPIYCIKKFGYSKKGCPIRIGSTCQEMSDNQIAERCKEKFNKTDLLINVPSNLNELSFRTLKNYYLDKGYTFNVKTYERNLKLKNRNGNYNVMAELLSDNNRYSLIFVKFNGLDKSSISQRSDYGKKSILFAYEQLMNRIAAENICNSDTSIRPRVDTYLFDYDSVNEAIVNAIVHNDWTISEPQISFFDDRIEILSHGGLPRDLTINEFYEGISKPKNDQLMKIFSDLDIVDHTGHGIPIILNKYEFKAFKIAESYVKVTIPFNTTVSETKVKNVDVNVDVNVDINLSLLDMRIISYLKENPHITSNEIFRYIRKTKRTVDRSIKKLRNLGYIVRCGSDKNGHWKILKEIKS